MGNNHHGAYDVCIIMNHDHPGRWLGLEFKYREISISQGRTVPP